MANLPSGYLQLEWIQSTRSQFIRTGLYAYGNDIIEIRGNYTSIEGNQQMMLGCHRSGCYRRLIIVYQAPGETYQSFGANGGCWNENTEQSGWNSVGTKLCPADTLTHTFIYNHANATFAIDDTVYNLQNNSTRSYPGDGSEVYKMVLFGNCHDSLEQTGGMSKFRLEYAKFTQSGVVTREYIPALRLSDKKPGLFDTVSQTFFINEATTGIDFLYPLENYRTYIHDKFIEQEWIKSTGANNSSVVNVGSFNGKLKVIYDAILQPEFVPAGSDNGLFSSFGTNNYGGSSGSAQMLSIAASQANHIMLRVNGTWWSTGVNSYERHTMELEQFDSYTTLKVTDLATPVALSMPATFNTNGKDLYFFGNYHAATSTVYSAKIYVDGTLTMDLIPVKDSYNNTYGLYNKLTNIYYPFVDSTGITGEDKEEESGIFLYESDKSSLKNGDNTYISYKTVTIGGGD